MADERLRTKSELKRLFTNLKGKPITEEMMGILVDVLWRDKTNIRTSGFEFPKNFDSVISVLPGTRTFTIAPFDPGVAGYEPRYGVYVWNNTAAYERIYSTLSIQFPNEEGLYCIYFDKEPNPGRSQILHIVKNPVYAQLATIYTSKIIVSFIYWDAENGDTVYFGDERHGSEYNPQVQWWANGVFNGLLLEGMELVNVPDATVPSGYDGGLDRDAQVGVAAGRWAHEDIFIDQPAIDKTAGLPVFWFETVSGSVVPRVGGTTGFPVDANGGIVKYNPGGTAIGYVGTGNYFLMHFFATNCRLYPVIAVMGRSQHKWVESAFLAAENELKLVTADLVQQTWLHLGSVVFQGSEFLPIAAKSRMVGLVTPEAIADFLAIDKAVFTKHGWMPNIRPTWYNHPETPLLLTSVQGDGDFYYWQGEKTEADLNYDISFDDEYGMQYGIMDQILGIVGVNTPWRLDAVDKLMFGAFFWNPDQQKRLYCGYNMYSYELHPNERFQRYFNKATNHISGLVATINATVNLTHTVNVTNGEIQSVDIVANISHSIYEGGWGQYMQYLKASKYYLQTNTAITRWRVENAIPENVVILDDDDEVVYNQLDGTDYKLTPTVDGDYIAMWLVASMDYLEPMKWIAGSQVSATVEEAREANSADTLQAMIDATEFFCLEYVVVARVIAKNIAADPFYELIEIETYEDGDFEQLTNDRHVTGMEWDEATKTLTLKRNDKLPDLVKVLSVAVEDTTAIDTILGLMTGWNPGAWGVEVMPSFDDGTLEFTLTPITATFGYFVQGVWYSKSVAESIAIADTTGEHFIVYNGADLEEITIDEWVQVLQNKTKCLVAAIYWNATEQKAILKSAEPHTHTISGQEHYRAHTSEGTRYVGGLGLTIAANNWQLNVEEGTIVDEDIPIVIQDDITKIFGQNLTVLESLKLYRFGLAAWKYDVTIPANIVYLSAGNKVYHNVNTLGTWTLAETDVNRYSAMWAVATNDWDNPVIMVMGQGDSGTLKQAQDGNLLADMNFSGLPTAEFRILGRVIVKCIAASPYYEIVEIESMQADDIKPGGDVTTDSYVIGASYDDATHTLTITRNNGLPAITVVMTGMDGTDGADGIGIISVALTSTVGLVDTYTITYSDSSTSTFDVTNGADGTPGSPGTPGAPGADGEDGVGIASIELTDTQGLVKTYTITFTDASTFDFDVTDGADGAPGNDGREIELQENAGWVEWRYVGDVAWTQLYEIPAGGDGVDNFLDLTDTPDDYTGQGGKMVVVKADETGLEFVEVPEGGGGTITVVTEGEDIEIYIDFVDDIAYTYTCPFALRFLEMEYENAEPALSVALNTAMAKYDDLVVTPDGAGLVIIRGKVETAFVWDVYIDFELAEATTYKCPYALRFDSMEHEQANAPVISPAIGTSLAKYDVVTVTPDAVGLVTLIGVKL